MPSTLGHIGLHGLGSRAVWRGADAKWILAGLILPDLPWIVRRALQVVAPGIDPFALRTYASAQTSFAVTLLLAGALALASARPRPVFGLLALNSLAHLVLDALERKWGPGVLLGAPFSWREWNAGFFWPEHPISYALVAVGAGFAVWLLRRPGETIALCAPPRWAAAVLLAGYAFLPLLAHDALLDANPQLASLAAPRAGGPVALDRVKLLDDGTIRAWTGQRFATTDAMPEGPATISVRGRFADAGTIRVEDLHVHEGPSRDWFSYAGLLCIGWFWVRRR